MNINLDTGQVLPLFCNNHLDSWKTPDSIQKLDLSGKSIMALARVASATTDENFFKVRATDLPECVEVVAEIKKGIFSSSGAVLLHRFPVECYSIAVSRRAAGILSNLISPLMPQDIKGTMLYDLVDDGPDKSNTTRSSITNVEEPFHTDGTWLEEPPHVIGLFCLKQAEHGGFSRMSSIQKTLLALFDEDPSRSDLLTTHNAYWNKMGQFAGDEQAFSEHPVIEYTGTGTLIRHYADYVRTGHELAGVLINDELSVLLNLIDQRLVDKTCEPFRLESGELQFINNWSVAHAQAKFSGDRIGNDSPPVRHLVRLWNRTLQSFVN